ncbi:MAG: YggS family pyridoxal phosphate-dependent enzyme [Actinomycetota bacterium]
MDEVRGRIARACGRVGRAPREVRLIGVTKEAGAGRVSMAFSAGLTDFGENYVQELEAKRAVAPDATWHFIGRIQRNKARRILAAADVVHTLEPGRAADRLASLAGERRVPLECLVEVDFTGGRVGVAPHDAEDFAIRMARTGGVRITGLMTVPPLEEPPGPFFARLREIRDRVRASLPDVVELSMGMSADYEEAVEEGATMVRVGAAIFGPRQ